MESIGSMIFISGAKLYVQKEHPEAHKNFPDAFPRGCRSAGEVTRTDAGRVLHSQHGKV